MHHQCYSQQDSVKDIATTSHKSGPYSFGWFLANLVFHTLTDLYIFPVLSVLFYADRIAVLGNVILQRMETGKRNSPFQQHHFQDLILVLNCSTNTSCQKLSHQVSTLHCASAFLKTFFVFSQDQLTYQSRLLLPLPRFRCGLGQYLDGRYLEKSSYFRIWCLGIQDVYSSLWAGAEWMCGAQVFCAAARLMGLGWDVKLRSGSWHLWLL